MLNARPSTVVLPCYLLPVKINLTSIKNRLKFAIV